MHGYVKALNILLDEDPNLVPLEQIFLTSLCLDIYSTLAPIVPFAIVVAPSPVTIESLVWRLKHLPRNRRVPERLLDFEHSIA